MRDKKLAILTGGGDCPGLNAAIRAVVKAAQHEGIRVFGFEQGFLGLYENEAHEMTNQEVSGILPRGGTILRSSRFNPFKGKKILNTCLENFRRQEFSGLIVIGGDGSLSIAYDLHVKHKIPVNGIPKTIDNDVFGTDRTIGFYTAVQTAMEAIDKLHTTAESHNFIMIVEVMGRHCGYIAAFAGIAGGADYVMIPETRVKLGDLMKSIEDRYRMGKNFSIIVVAEDAKLVDEKGRVLAQAKSLRDEYGKIKLGGIGAQIKDILQDKLGYEARYTNLGHVQRGGSPVALDRYLATAFGVEAASLAKKNRWGHLIAYVNGHVAVRDLGIVRQGHKRLPREIYELAKVFF